MLNVVFHIIINISLLFLFVTFVCTFLKLLENYQDAENKTKAARKLILSPFFTIKDIFYIIKGFYSFIKNLLGINK